MEQCGIIVALKRHECEMSGASEPHTQDLGFCRVITHGSALSTFGVVSQGPGPQSRKYPKKDGFATKPKGPKLRLLETEVAYVS